MYAIITIWQCTERILIEPHVSRNGPTSSRGHKSQRLSSDLPSQRTIQPVKTYRYFRRKFVSVLDILTYMCINIPYLCGNLPLWLKTMITLSHPEFKQNNKNTKHNGPYNLQEKSSEDYKTMWNWNCSSLLCFPIPETVLLLRSHSHASPTCPSGNTSHSRRDECSRSMSHDHALQMVILFV